MGREGSYSFYGDVYAQAWAASRECREREEQERLRLISEWRAKAEAFDWLAGQAIISTPGFLWAKQHGQKLLDALQEKLGEQRVQDEARAERMAERQR